MCIRDSHITDYEIYTDSSNNRIIVRFPWKNGETDFDPEAAIEELAATAELTFRPGGEYKSTETAEDGSIIYKTPTGETAETVLLTGADVDSATAEAYRNTTTNQLTYQVSLNLTDSGKKKFAEATEKYLNKTISIWMDDVMISAPTVQNVISDGKASITGGFDAEEATDLAEKINAGALPFKLTTSNFSTLSPTLGMSSLNEMCIRDRPVNSRRLSKLIFPEVKTSCPRVTGYSSRSTGKTAPFRSWDICIRSILEPISMTAAVFPPFFLFIIAPYTTCYVCRVSILSAKKQLSSKESLAALLFREAEESSQSSPILMSK